MNNDDLEARIAAKAKKKKTRKAENRESSEQQQQQSKDDGEKKKKKSSKSNSSSGGVGGGAAKGSTLLEERIKAKQAAASNNGEATTPKKKKASKKQDEDDYDMDKKPKAKSRSTKEKKSALDRLDAKVAAKDDRKQQRYNQQQQEDKESKLRASATDISAAAHAAASNASTKSLDANANYGGEAEVVNEMREYEMTGKDKEVRYGYDDGEVVEDGEAYYPNVEADTDVMAEINQEGVVQVDEAGGIQAFVAETIAIDGDDVGIIRSDAEVEKEEKKKYTKFFMYAVGGLILVVVAIAVPLTLKFAKGNQKVQLNVITKEPTSFPSLMPSESPSSMPSSIRFMEIVEKLEPLSGDALKVQGSPQYKAAMWMADGDMMRLPLDNAGFEQRYIMALFYYAMDGPNWTEDNGWLSETSECYWFGIDGSSEGCGGERGGCIKRSDFVGDFDKVCRIAMGEFFDVMMLVALFSFQYHQCV